MRREIANRIERAKSAAIEKGAAISVAKRIRKSLLMFPRIQGSDLAQTHKLINSWIDKAPDSTTAETYERLEQITGQKMFREITVLADSIESALASDAAGLEERISQISKAVERFNNARENIISNISSKKGTKKISPIEMREAGVPDKLYLYKSTDKHNPALELIWGDNQCVVLRSSKRPAKKYGFRK